MTSQELDLAYRWLFGMIPDMSMLSAHGITTIPKTVDKLFDRLPAPPLNMDLRVLGYGCGNALQDIYGEYTQNMRCSGAHGATYTGIMNYIKELVLRNDMHVVFVDLANFMAGKLANYDRYLDQLPVIYRGRPVIYVIVLPQWEITAPTFVNNKVVLPVTCVVPTPHGLVRCPKDQPRETDDILLIQLYNYIHESYPHNAHILSGDKYRWRGSNNLPVAHINYVRIVRKPIGLSPVSLAVNNVINRKVAFSVADGNDLPDYSNPKPKAAKPVVAKPAAAAKPTLFCRHYITTGKCPYGAKCTFAHTRKQLDPSIRKVLKTRDCKKGDTCPIKQVCKYRHPDEVHIK